MNGGVDRQLRRIDYDVYGVVVRVHGPDEIVDLVDDHKPPCWVPTVNNDADLLLTVLEGDESWRIERDDAEPVAAGISDPLVAAHALLGDAHFEIACRSRRFLYIHAGVVGIDGKALLIPGRTHSGKTTLTAELVRQGATYLSDEYAVIGPDLLIYPYARELAIRDEAGKVTPTPVSELGGGEAGTEPLPAGSILWTHYVKSSTWAPTRVRGSRTVRPLFDNAVLARDEGAELFERLSRLMPGIDVWEGDRPQAAHVAAAILERNSLNPSG